MDAQKKNIGFSWLAWAKEVFFTRRMQSGPGFILIALVGAVVGLAGTAIDPKAPIIMTAIVAGILYLAVCMRYPEFAYYGYFCSIIFFTLPARFFNAPIPLGTVIEPTGYIAVFAAMAEQYRKKQSASEFWRTPISLMMLLLFCYFLLQAFNPDIDNRAGWFNFFRKQIINLLFYYTSFLMLDSIEKIRRFIKVWLVLALLIAL